MTESLRAKLLREFARMLDRIDTHPPDIGSVVLCHGVHVFGAWAPTSSRDPATTRNSREETPHVR